MAVVACFIESSLWMMCSREWVLTAGIGSAVLAIKCLRKNHLSAYLGH